MILTLILLMCIGIIEALSDAGIFYKTPPFMDPGATWTRKYIDNDPTKSFKWWGLAEFIIPDPWHIGKWVTDLMAISLIVSGAYHPLFGMYGDIFLMLMVWRGSFQVAFWEFHSETTGKSIVQSIIDSIKQGFTSCLKKLKIIS